MPICPDWPPKKEIKSINTKYYYKGKDSLYKFGYEWQLNSWEQDIIKRVVRCGIIKGTWEEDYLKQLMLLKFIYKSTNRC